LNLEQLLDRIEGSPERARCITCSRTLPARPGRYRPFPPQVRPELVRALSERGVSRLYLHQAQAFEAVTRGENAVVVTPTASGKTLCYNLPVLNEILRRPESRALYLFPTKALSQDQMGELHALLDSIDRPISTHTYDGDTPVAARRAIRSAAHIVVTNPDMLHTGILPHHTKWNKLFENLEFVVIDELHNYRGVFGSHVANVIRRLKRICRFYGSSPRFVLCSATIANPAELASDLIGGPVTLIDENGAPSGEKRFIFYNPPVVNRRLGIRRSALLEGRALAASFLKNGVQTIIFARTRLAVEVLLTYLRDAVSRSMGRNAVRGYRGGYLPSERRRIERGLRTGEVRGVVSTNALELGVDIGELDACVIVGYPGTISSTWQQAGRAGRRAGLSCAVLVASSAPLDQYIVNHPEYFFGRSPENGLINPDNLLILVSHLKCAAFELPFSEDERFGTDATPEVLRYLEEQGVLHRAGGRYHWSAESYPAEEVSLRSATAGNVVIVDVTDSPRVIGEVDPFSAMTLVHEEAIYIHEGQQYQVERFDHEERKAYARRVDVDYYTDANLAVNLKVLDVLEEAREGRAEKRYGEVSVSALATIFKKIKFNTHETVGWGKVHLPEQELHTSAYSLSLLPEVYSGMGEGELESGLAGLSNLLVNVAPLYLMCDPRDVRGVAQLRSPFSGLPTIFIYDSYPGGVGLAEKLYDLHPQLLDVAREALDACPCADGCPSCVGPAADGVPAGKRHVRRLLDELGTAGR